MQKSFRLLIKQLTIESLITRLKSIGDFVLYRIEIIKNVAEAEIWNNSKRMKAARIQNDVRFIDELNYQKII